MSLEHVIHFNFLESPFSYSFMMYENLWFSSFWSKKTFVTAKYTQTFVHLLFCDADLYHIFFQAMSSLWHKSRKPRLAPFQFQLTGSTENVLPLHLLKSFKWFSKVFEGHKLIIYVLRLMLYHGNKSVQCPLSKDKYK